MGAVGFDEAGAELPASSKLGNLQQQRIPAGLQGDIHFVGTRRQPTEGVIGVHDGIIEPDLHAIVGAQFESGRLLLIAIYPGLRVGDALLAAEGLQQVHNPRALWVGP